MGTGLNDAKHVGAMVVDVGGGTTDCRSFVIRGVVVSESLASVEILLTNLLFAISVVEAPVIGPLTAEKLKFL